MDGHAFAGALFDWDGVIIDSHAAHAASWEAMARELGQPLPPDFMSHTFGMRNDRIIPGFTTWARADEPEKIAALGGRKEALYREILRREGIEPLPGVRRLLETLAEAGIPCCVGSSTPRENILTVMELTGLGPLFAGICSAEDVTRGKPAPDVFLKAAQKIGCDPAECVVFEDAHVGVEAARAAGASVVAVCTTHPAESFLGKAGLIVGTLEEVTLDALRALVTDRQ